jgi:hypothetical protein
LLTRKGERKAVANKYGREMFLTRTGGRRAAAYKDRSAESLW